MQKFNSTILFFLILVLLTVATNNAQYKLNIGNFWIYSGDSNERKISIIDRSILFDSVLFYEFNEQIGWRSKSNNSYNNIGNTNQYFIRQRDDHLFEELIVYNAIGDTVIQPYSYKYNSKLGDKWIYRTTIDNTDSTDIDTLWAEVVNVFEGYQFGEWRTIKKITYWTGLTDFSKYFCDDFGELSEENYLGVVSWLKGCYIDGVAYGDTSFISVGVTNDLFPNESILLQNFPNPFNPVTIINYSISKESKIKLIVYDLIGEEVAILIDDIQTTGNYKVNFDASRFKLVSGIYFYTLISDDFSQTKKMIYLR